MKAAAFQMDHPSRLNARGDSTLMLIEEGCKRGIACYYFSPLDLSLNSGELSARVRPITVDSARDPVWSLGEPQCLSLHTMGVVWMRQDPPFNMQYITATHLLEHLLPDTPVFNNPASVRNAPEKLSVLHFKHWLPPTLVSNDVESIHAFAAEHGTVVAKPLHGYGGRSVFKLAKDDPNIDTLIEHWRELTGEPLMWQAFLPEVATQDTRVVMIHGAIAGAFSREPQAGSIRANMRVGGTPKKTALTAKQQAICETLGPFFREQGLAFVGIDLIGDYLTEINITSPTGLRAVEQLYGTNLAVGLWDSVAPAH